MKKTKKGIKKVGKKQLKKVKGGRAKMGVDVGVREGHICGHD
jgi:hypothetical protein